MSSPLAFAITNALATQFDADLVRRQQADLLGFKAIIQNLEDESQRTRVQEWADLCNEGASQFNIEHHRLISDTLFAVVDDTVEGLRRLTKFSRYLLEAGIDKNLPLRGGIAFGSVQWDGEITFGKAITGGFLHCEAQEWLGISFADSVKQTAELYNEKMIVNYHVPLKTGKISTRPAVIWSVPSFTELVSLLTRRGLADLRTPNALGNFDWSWANKVQNTILFGMYLRVMNNLQNDVFLPNLLYFTLPIQLLDSLSRSELRISLEDWHFTNTHFFNRTIASSPVSFPVNPNLSESIQVTRNVDEVNAHISENVPIEGIAKFVKYFAFGTDMEEQSMHSKCPNARFERIMKAERCSLWFPGSLTNNTIGPGEASIFHYAELSTFVEGVVYDIPEGEFKLLCESISTIAVPVMLPASHFGGVRLTALQGFLEGSAAGLPTVQFAEALIAAATGRGLSQGYVGLLQRWTTEGPVIPSSDS